MKQELLDFEQHQSLTSPHNIKKKVFDPRLNLAVMASGEGTNFEAIVNSTRLGQLHADISILIVNKRNCNAIQRANKFEIPYTVIDHKSFKSRKEMDYEIVKHLKSKKVEGVVMAGWMRIVTPTLINYFPDRIINIHPSLLPSFRGKNAINEALSSGVRITGCTVHLVRPDVDSGPILIQSAVPIYESDNIASLTQRIQLKEHTILHKGISIAASKWREVDV